MACPVVRVNGGAYGSNVPRPLDRVSVQMPRRKAVVVVPWRSCDVLLARLRDLENGRPIVNAFEAVGARRPVDLSDDEAVLLLKMIEGWLGDEPVDVLPAGI